jgi:hypothetical protein
MSVLTDFSWDAFIGLQDMLPPILLALTLVAIVWFGLSLLAQYIGLSGGIRFVHRKQRRACASLRSFIIGQHHAR